MSKHHNIKIFCSSTSKYVALGSIILASCTQLHAETIIKRLNNSTPIIEQSHFKKLGVENEGKSINGPSLIRVPSWLKENEKADPSANYYLYFGDHSGKYIRMAWAASVEGPYHIFNTGSNNTAQPGSGVLDLAGASISFTNGRKIENNHISSPDVVIDEENQQMLLFFHSGDDNHSSSDGDYWFDTGKQKTYVATSHTGLNFNAGKQVSSSNATPGEPDHGIKSTTLGNAYFRTFKYNNTWYAFSNYGPIWQGPKNNPPWSSSWSHERWPKNTVSGGGNPVWMDLYENYLQVNATAPRYYAGYDGTGTSPYGENEPRTGAPRHFALRTLPDGKTLEVYYTSRGEKPEGIFKTKLDMSSGSYANWDTKVLDDSHPQTSYVHEPILFPELPWEGSDLKKTVSKNGGEHDVNALRDPYVFTDSDGRSYLLYSGNPESAIGIASLNNRPTATIKVSTINITEGETVTFNGIDSSDTDGHIVSYLWDFDGASSRSRQMKHTISFLKMGDFEVSLTVTDNAGDSHTEAMTIKVHKDTSIENENNAPTFSHGSSIAVNMDQGGTPKSFNLTLNAKDKDADEINWKINSQAKNGVASVGGKGENKTINYFPDKDFFGQDSFVVEISDGKAGSDKIKVTVNVKKTPINDTEKNKLHITSATSSNDDGNLAGNVLDGKFDTRWSSSVNGAELVLGLEDTQQIGSLMIAFYQGGKRQTYFEVFSSSDATNWTSLGDYTSSGITSNLERVNIPDTHAKYIKIVGHGNSTSNWNSITEIKFNAFDGDIENSLPISFFTINTSTIMLGDKTFVNANKSTDSDGNIVDYSWNWGDGSSSKGVESNHTYIKNGTYTIGLTVTDDEGGTNIYNKTISVVDTNTNTHTGYVKIKIATAGWGWNIIGDKTNSDKDLNTNHKTNDTQFENINSNGVYWLTPYKLK